MEIVLTFNNKYDHPCNNRLFFQPIFYAFHHINYSPKKLNLRLFDPSRKRHIFCIKISQSFSYLMSERIPKFFVQHCLDLNLICLYNTAERKGKLVEKRGRKATGLKLKSQGSRVAENWYLNSSNKVTVLTSLEV